jgi:hypothetical protein
MSYSTPPPQKRSWECIIYAEWNSAINILTTTPVHAIQLLYMRSKQKFKPPAVYMLLDSPRSFSTPSYVPNMMAALGTTRNMCGTRPPYSAAMPSSFQMSLKHCVRPVYLSRPSCWGACRKRVRTTYALVSLSNVGWDG